MHGGPGVRQQVLEVDDVVSQVDKRLLDCLDRVRNTRHVSLAPQQTNTGLMRTNWVLISD
jgi:hypothetical protein